MTDDGWDEDAAELPEDPFFVEFFGVEVDARSFMRGMVSHVAAKHLPPERLDEEIIVTTAAFASMLLERVGVEEDDDTLREATRILYEAFQVLAWEPVADAAGRSSNREN